MLITKYLKFLEKSNNKNMWNIIPQSIKELHELFKQNDKKLYLVGGSVRDFLNGEEPKDFDLCTNALPDEVLKIVGNKYKIDIHGNHSV